MTMTETARRRVDSDRVDDSYRRWPQVLVALLVGVVLGALVGAGYGATRPATYQASTALSVLPDPTVDITSQNNNQNGTPSLDATAYIQSQLVIINGRQLAEQVRDSLDLSSVPDITATQVGQTYVVQIQTTAGSARRAAAIARETGTQYISVRTTQLRAEINGLLRSTGQQLSAVARSLASAQRTRPSTASVTPSQTALQTEYERLLSVRSTLNAVLEQSSGVVTVVSPARAVSSALSPTAKDTLGGAIAGAILALVLLFVLRRSRHRVRSLTDLAELDVPVLLPVLPRPTLTQLRSGAVRPGTEARVLATRLVADAGGDRRPLVFVAPAAGDGAASVAASMAAALADPGPVLLVQTGGEFLSGDPWVLADLDNSLPRAERAAVVRSAIPGVWLLDNTEPLTARRLLNLLDEAPLLGWQLVVEAGAVSRADVAMGCARAGAAVVLVVDRGCVTPSAVLAATELFEATGAALLGVLLNDSGGFVGRRRQGRSVPVESLRSAGRQDESKVLSSMAVPGESFDPAVSAPAHRADGGERRPVAGNPYPTGRAHRTVR